MSNERTWRESRVNIPAQTPTRFAEGNTRPNYFIIVNNSAGTLFVGVSPIVDNTTFEIVVPPMGTRTYARPDPPNELWIYATAAANVYIGSMEKPFEPSMVSQTQEIAGVAAGGLLGIVGVKAIMEALPVGANYLGQIGIFGAIPAGNNLIGKVEITALPELPVGNNKIGGVDIYNIAGNTFKEQLTEVDAVGGILTFTDNIQFIEIINTDTVNQGTFTVNGIAIKIAAGGSFGKVKILGVPGMTVTIAAALTYIVNVFS